MNVTAYKIINYFSLTKIIFIELLDSLHPCLFFTIFLLFQRVVKDYSLGIISFNFRPDKLLMDDEAARAGTPEVYPSGVGTLLRYWNVMGVKYFDDRLMN